MAEAFPRAVRPPGQPETPREVPGERRHSPPKIVDHPIDAEAATVAIALRAPLTGHKRPVWRARRTDLRPGARRRSNGRMTLDPRFQRRVIAEMVWLERAAHRRSRARR